MGAAGSDGKRVRSIFSGIKLRVAVEVRTGINIIGAVGQWWNERICPAIGLFVSEIYDPVQDPFLKYICALQLEYPDKVAVTTAGRVAIACGLNVITIVPEHPD